MKLGRRDRKSSTGFEEGSMEDYKERQRQYRIIKNAVKNNERLANMTIGNQSWNMGDEFNDRKGLNACTFEDENGNIIVVYRGTGSGEWGDNAEGVIGLNIETIQQVQGMKYFDYIVEKNEYHKKNLEITVTGHSKGGNKAQYITINSKYRDLIKYCFSFDGQGFSPEAVKIFKYRFDDYDESVKKIYGFNGENDFVNPFGMYVIPKEKRFYFNIVIPSEIPLNMDSRGDVLKFLKNIKNAWQIMKLHLPDSCLTEDGDFSEQVEQGSLSLFVENLSEEALRLEPLERDAIFRSIMSFVQGDDETVSGEIVASFSDKFAALMSLSTLADFAGKALLDTTREKKGIVAELLAARALAGICPKLFEDDLERIKSRNTKVTISDVLEFLKKLGGLTTGSYKDYEKNMTGYSNWLNINF